MGEKIKKNIISAVTISVLMLSPVLAFAQTPDNDFKKSLDEFKQERETFKAAREEARTEKRKEKKAEREAKHLETKKRVLTKLVEVASKHAARTKERLNKMKFLDEALKNQALAGLDAVIAKLNEFKTTIDAAKTVDELKTLAQEIRDYRKTVQEGTVKRVVGLILVSKAERHALKKTEERIAKTEAKIAELKAAGKDVSELEHHLSLAKTALENVKAKIAAAKEAVNAIKTKEDFETARKLTKEINDAVKEVYKDLKKVFEVAKDLVEKPEETPPTP